MYQTTDFKIHIKTTNGSMIPSPYSILLAKNIPTFKYTDVVIDVGCGCGILGIVSFCKGSDNVIMTDVTDSAILDTKENCILNKIYNIKVIKSDIYNNFFDLFYGADFIICNPPSLPCSLNKNNKPEYFSGEDGRKFIDQLLSRTKIILKNTGKILMTHTSLANIDKTFELIKKIKGKVKIIDKIELKFRYFYDIDHIKSLNNKKLYIEKLDGLYEIIYVLEINFLTNKNEQIKSKL
jgi:methylase of polypeptide subunit release factors